MPRHSPLALRNGERAIVDRTSESAPPDDRPRPITLPIRRKPRLLSAGTQEIPEGAHSFRFRILEPGCNAVIGEHPSRVIQPAAEVTVVIDYLTEDQARLLSGSPADSGVLLRP